MPNSLRELEVFSYPTDGTKVEAGETATGQFMLVEALENTVISSLTFQGGTELVALPQISLGGRIGAYLREFTVDSGSVIVWHNNDIHPITIT